MERKAISQRKLSCSHLSTGLYRLCEAALFTHLSNGTHDTGLYDTGMLLGTLKYTLKNVRLQQLFSRKLVSK